tara:strand:+ start:151 stop:636 length:486 start_codon:yes stop_codon:yes gene_type:complete
MDTLSHALWGRGVFGYRGRPYWSLFFGALPDLFSFGIYFFFNLFFNISNFKFGKPELNEIPNYVFNLYDITHSMVIALLFIFIVYFFVNKNFAFAMLGWPLHIMLDFPFHTADFFPTPILWPIVDVQFNGISWSTPYIWFSNIAGIIILYIWRYRSKLKSK